MTRRSKAVLLLAFVCIGLLGASTYLFIQNQSLRSGSVQAQDGEAKEAVEKLEQIYAIDTDSKPTIARIDNPEKLKSSNKTFYKNTLKGDYLIVYPNKAFIYRPSVDKIINVADIVGDAP